MAYRKYTYPELGQGLRLDQKVDAVGPAEAIDALNVVYAERGAITQRAGTEVFTDSELTNPVSSLHPYYGTDGTKQLIAGCGTRLEALDTDGTVAASSTGLTAGTWAFARFGTPNAEVVYAGNGNNLLEKWDGSAWSQVSGSPMAGALGVLTVSNRLVASRFIAASGEPSGGGAASSPSTVYFSDAGLPETWPADNYIHLTPGDGEAIQAIQTWREYVFVFKESKFFVFYSESVDVTGAPIFNYRTVDTGEGAGGPLAVTANESGVYFANRRGLFVTTGAEPTYLSQPVAPIFEGGAERYYMGGLHDHAANSLLALHSHHERLYLGLGVGDYGDGDPYNDRTLVYDYINDWWSLFDFPAADFASFRATDVEELVFGYSTGTNDIACHRAGLTNDATVAITSRWRSGFSSLDQPEIKRVREQKVWGIGIVFCAVAPDYQFPVGSLVSLDMSSPEQSVWGAEIWGGSLWAEPGALVPRLRRRALQAATVSVYFENTALDQEWSVHRVSHHIAAGRQASIRKVVQ